ncbi:PspC domain-containing protein [Mitsuaria sp. WAJ17]|uniref:PspC domain-containing protein n=1 Tax=Mitsuaria sp. WAJ17 TaxID=2761452 RepID=UPI00160493F3|nr:PspC domain-containing protein [Mitsuaria sp. WAJ17]MBB2483876.1 PspC domain-containing protein [Mitsuaria sp. WAJ17]
MSSMSSELERLAELHRQGQLSDEEFARAKARILQGEAAAAPGSAPGSAPFGSPATGQVLRRSLNDRWLGGVCGGLGRMTNVESWIWRLLFVLTSLCVGGGLLVYLLLWIFVPEE